MERSFLPNQASREEGEELDRFALGRDALCVVRRRKRATEGAARDHHAVDGVLGSAVEKQGRKRCCGHTGPCTRCTMDREGRRKNGRGPPWIAFETHGPSLQVYHEPSARARNLFEIHIGVAARSMLTVEHQR
jgi:hypothetical protein